MPKRRAASEINVKTRISLLARDAEDALARFAAGEEVVIIPITDAEKATLRDAITKTDFLGWFNTRFFNATNQLNLDPIKPEHWLGEEKWPFSRSKKLRFPNADMGFLNLYWSPVHEAAWQLESVIKVFDHRLGIKDWVIDPNRFRAAQPGTGKSESVHIDHNGLNPNRIGRPASVLALSKGRTFSWFTGTSTPAFLTRLRDTYRSQLSENKHYVVLDIEKDGDPLALGKLRTQVNLEMGDLLIFNDSLVHEVALNDTDYMQLSLFMSPRDPHKQPEPIGKPLTSYTFHERHASSASYYPNTMSLSGANQLSWLLGIQPPVWPSGKPTYMVHTQALASYEGRVRIREFAINPDGDVAFPIKEGLPPLESVNETIKQRKERLTAAGIVVPLEAYNLGGWHNDPTRLSPILQYRLGFRASMPSHASDADSVASAASSETPRMPSISPLPPAAAGAATIAALPPTGVSLLSTSTHISTDAADHPPTKRLRTE
jgi:hypothetical protein